MFAVQFTPRFANRPAPWATKEGFDAGRGEGRAVLETRAEAEALRELAASRGYIRPVVRVVDR